MDPLYPTAVHTSQLWKCMDITDEDTVTAWEPQRKTLKSLKVSTDTPNAPSAAARVTIERVSALQLNRRKPRLKKKTRQSRVDVKLERDSTLKETPLIHFYLPPASFHLATSARRRRWLS